MKLVLFDLQNQKSVSETRNNNRIFLKFTPDSNYLGSGNNSGTVQVFKVPCLTLMHKIDLGRSSVSSLAFSTDNMLLASAFEENLLIVQSIGDLKIVYREENVIVKSLVFCFNNQRLIYSISFKIIVLDKYYKKIAVLNIRNAGLYLFVSEDNRKVLVTDFTIKWSCVDAVTSKILFNNLNSNHLKNWRARDPKLRFFMSEPGINFS